LLGNPVTSAQVVRDSALYRAAEVTLKTGNRYFTIVNGFDKDFLGARGVVHVIYCHSAFMPDSIDAAQLMSVIGTAYQS
jgi:hypothetical protein